jgi:hypothetical protein
MTTRLTNPLTNGGICLGNLEVGHQPDAKINNGLHDGSFGEMRKHFAHLLLYRLMDHTSVISFTGGGLPALRVLHPPA